MHSVARSKFTLFTALLAAAAFAGTLALAQQPQGGGGGLDFANMEVETMHVQGNVWLATAGPFNAAFSVGEDGVLVVDTMVAPLAEKLLAAIREVAGARTPIRYIFNTHWHADHIGGNEVVGAAGQSVVAGNFAGQAGAGQRERAFIWAHENTLHHMTDTEQGPNPIPVPAWPTDVFFDERKELFFNGEPVVLYWMPNAHTDGDVVVFFRRSDVIVSGDVYQNTMYPIIRLDEGGSYAGTVDALFRLVELTVPRDKQEGGTYVIPGHGRIVDEADVVEYRDMVTIIRDRIQDAISKGMTLEQVKAANLTLDYDPRYGSEDGFWTTDAFIEAAYQSLSQRSGNVSQNR